MEPDHVGGGTIDVVTHQFVTWKDSPEKDEAGSPNVLGVLVLISAIKTLNKIGMDNIERYEKEILDRKSTRLNSSHANISYAVFCLKKKKKNFYLQASSSNSTSFRSVQS